MNKALLISSLLLSLAHGEDHQQALEVDTFGLSWHTNRDAGFNQKNPGGGVEWTTAIDEEDTKFVLAVGSYLDSYEKKGRYALAGLRLPPLGSYDTLHATLEFMGGYMDESGYDGFMMGPVFSVGYSIVDIGFTGDYAKDSTAHNPNGTANRNASSSSFIGFFARIRCLTF